MIVPCNVPWKTGDVLVRQPEHWLGPPYRPSLPPPEALPIPPGWTLYATTPQRFIIWRVAEQAGGPEPDTYVTRPPSDEGSAVPSDGAPS